MIPTAVQEQIKKQLQLIAAVADIPLRPEAAGKAKKRPREKKRLVRP